jgi:hypothetical protein
MLCLRVANHGMLMRGAEQSEGQAIRCAHVHFQLSVQEKTHHAKVMICVSSFTHTHTHTQTHTRNSWSRSRYITNSRSTN